MTKLSQLKIDPEFQRQINPPTFEEKHQLEMNMAKAREQMALTTIVIPISTRNDVVFTPNP